MSSPATPSIDPTGLVADLGGTHCRLVCVAADGSMSHVYRVETADYPGPLALLRGYLDQLPPDHRPDRGALAIAGPVAGDQAHLTNVADPAWRFSLPELQAALGWSRLSGVNDFTAVALGLPHFTPADLRRLGGGEGDSSGPRAVLGPGTGLGVSGVFPDGTGAWRALSGEGGHVTLAGRTDQEAALLTILRRQYGHVSAERVLSGPGLAALARAMAEWMGRPCPTDDPVEITGRAGSADDPFCRQVIDQFCAFLGTVAGDLALTLGATGGVYLAGGILPRIADLLPDTPFHGRFVDKGRMSAYLEPIPCRLVMHPDPAFPGLAALLTAED